MPTWKKVATVDTYRDTTVCIPLYLSSVNGLKANNVSFLRTAGYVGTSSVNPQIEFSSTLAGTESQKVQNYSSGAISSYNDTSCAHILYDGDIYGAGMDSSTLDDNLIEAIGGCAFSVPLGDASKPEHIIDIDFMVSNDDATNATDTSAAIHFNLWRAHAGEGITWGNNQTNQTLRFDLVEDAFMPSASPEYFALPSDGGSIKYGTSKRISVPMGLGSGEWGGHTVLYLLGCWVDSSQANVSSALDPVTNSINWPNSSGTGNCSIKAWVNVQYRRYEAS